MKPNFNAEGNTKIAAKPEGDSPLISEDHNYPSSKGSVMRRGCTFFGDLLTVLIHMIWSWSGPGMLIAVLCYYHLGGGLLFIVVVITCLGLLYNGQDLLLYYPDQPDSSRVFVPPPSAVGIHSSLVENLFIKTADNISINAILVKQASTAISLVPTILFFHGNAGNIGHRLINAAVFHSVCHCNVLLVEYRGYGKSEGYPYEEGLYKDAQAALDYLHNRSDINSNFIFVFGRSLGGAIAIEIASNPRNRSKIRGLIVENTFTSIPDMGKHLFKMELIKWIPLCIVKNQYTSVQKMPKIRLPTLFISGAADELVPPDMMKILFERCRGAKKMAVFENGSHNDTWQLAGYCDTIKEFLIRYSGISVHPHPSRPSADQCEPVSENRIN